MSKTLVAVAMSGGVDSSLTAALLKEAGYQVIGISMQMQPDEGNGRASRPTCGSPRDLGDAGRVCQVLGLPFHVVDVRSQFETCVVDYFCTEYARGRTPNPCVVCNRQIKFDLLLRHALSLGAEYLATGHYARIERRGQACSLLRGADPSCDQSYFLYRLGETELQRLLFPVGQYTKAEVRRMAAERGLPVAGKPKSQDLCFVPEGRYHDFVAQRVSAGPGEVVDEEGRVVGRHRGIPFYTVGQRTGLGVASGERLYVLAIDAPNNRLVVGPKERLKVSRLRARDVSFVGDKPRQPVAVEAKIRYSSPQAGALLQPVSDGVEVQFDRPQRAVAPGQAVVFYQGDRVLGGGVIEAS